jgi:hypothetical protein
MSSSQWPRLSHLLSAGIALGLVAFCFSQSLAIGKKIEPELIHLRSGAEREWSSFPADCDRSSLEVHWQDTSNDEAATLELRQQDVKQAWRVRVNGENLGQLALDEQDVKVYFAIAPRLLRNGENVLRIEPVDKQAASDDIRVGQIRSTYHRSRKELLSEAAIEVRIVDADSKSPLPARVTIVDADGALQTTAAVSND